MRPSAHRHYLLVVLTIILVFNLLDRLALGLLLQEIKSDLNLSDTQLGVLGGIAFALFYSVMGVPIARWADRGNRVLIISLTAALWSVAVALCGGATTFLQLLLIRVVVAVGEAGCIPPAFSLIADYFNRAERPRAAAIYGLGGPIAGVVGYFLAGWLNELYGWRMTFVLLGAPGLLLAALAWFTLREPRNANRSSTAAALAQSAHAEPQPSLKEVMVTLWTNATFRHLLLALSVMFFFNYGVVMWQPAFFIRSHGMTTSEIGTWLALTAGIAGIAGTYLGGDLASRYAANNERLQLRAMAIAVAVAGALSCFIYITPNITVAFLLNALFGLGMVTVNGPLFATIQTLVPERMRAVSFALVYLFSNLIGMGLGPLAAGALSDAFRPSLGDESLRYALLCLSPGYLWVAWHAWKASNTVTSDLATAQQFQQQDAMRHERQWREPVDATSRLSAERG